MNEPPTIVTYGSTQNDNDEDQQAVLNDAEERALGMRMEISRAFSLLRYKYIAHISFYGCIAVFFGCSPTAVFLFLQCEWFAIWYIKYSSWIHAVVNSSNSIIFYILVACGFKLQPMFDMLRINHVLGNFAVCLNSGLLFGMESIDMVAVYLKMGSIDDQGILEGVTEEGAKSLTDDKGMSPDSWIFMVLTILAILATLMMMLNVFHLIYYEGVYLRILQDLDRSTEDAGRALPSS